MYDEFEPLDSDIQRLVSAAGLSSVQARKILRREAMLRGAHDLPANDPTKPLLLAICRELAKEYS